MKEDLINLVASNFKHIKLFFISILKNKLIISLAISLVTIGLIKFDDILPIFYKAPDLLRGREYLDKIIALGIEDDGSCTEKSQRARREIDGIKNSLYGIISAHKEDKAYKSLDIAFDRIFAFNSIRFCYSTELKKKHYG